MGILTGNLKDQLLHYGEIYNIWMSSTMAKGLVSSFQAYTYHAGNKDLKKILEDIPVGARFTDQEIGAMIATATSAGLVACSQVIGQEKRLAYPSSASIKKT